MPAGVDIVELSDEGNNNGGSSSSEASGEERALKAWAEGHGLQWPGEVVVLAPGGGQTKEGDAEAELLPGFRANSLQVRRQPALTLQPVAFRSHTNPH